MGFFAGISTSGPYAGYGVRTHRRSSSRRAGPGSVRIPTTPKLTKAQGIAARTLNVELNRNQDLATQAANHARNLVAYGDVDGYDAMISRRTPRRPDVESSNPDLAAQQDAYRRAFPSAN